ncbi:MAG: hypothetical protein M3325_10025 [Actinomycetota bacterium]|nr:hypothetical protein [Actinomycetota bacterium]
MSETYTAVYERDGEAWAVRIAEVPDVHILCPRRARVSGMRSVGGWAPIPRNFASSTIFLYRPRSEPPRSQ